MNDDRGAITSEVIATIAAHAAKAELRAAALEVKERRTVNVASNSNHRMQLARDLRFARITADAWNAALEFAVQTLAEDQEADSVLDVQP